MSETLFAVCSSLILLAGSSIQIANDRFQTARDNRLTLGILRGDGVVVPFAEFRDGTWSAPWPKLEEYGEGIDNTLADLPTAWFERHREATNIWYFGRSAGGRTRLRTSNLTRVRNHCQENWGLLSDFPGRALGANEHHKNIGVAVDTERRVETPLALSENSIEHQSVSPIIRLFFNKAEDLEASKLTGVARSIHFPSATKRRAVRAVVSKLHRNRSPLDGLTLYHFEAKKEYERPRSATDAGCNTMSVFSGWIMRDRRGELRLLSRQLVVDDCDMKAADYSTFLGLLTVGNRVFMITESHGYEQESYSILELRDTRIIRVLKVFGGAC